MPNSMVETALIYADEGLHVFPCHFIRENGSCSCGQAECSSPGKHPLTKNGVLDATVSKADIEKWWITNPQANIGIATGTSSGIWVLDVDGVEGIRALAQHELAGGYPDIPETPTAETGGGGQHLVFAYPNDRDIKNQTRIGGLPIDVRGDGGYVIAPPSRHASGKRYGWSLDPTKYEPVAAPDWILKLAASGRVQTNGNGNGKLMPLVMIGDLESDPGVDKGARHSRLCQLVGQHLQAGEDPLDVLQLALAWGGRCNPPVDADEVERVVHDLTKKNLSQPAPDNVGAKREKKSQATLLVELAADAELFHDTKGDAYATFEVDGHQETWRVRSKSFKQWLARRYWQQYQGAASSQAYQDAISVIEGAAVFDGDECSVYMRVAETIADAASDANGTIVDAKNAPADAADGVDAGIQAESNGIVIDLGTSTWESILIGPDGWKVISESPVKFRRPRGMLPLPSPVSGGNVADLRRFVNVNDEEWPLLLGWLLAALRPTGPYPILNLNGEQGSAKSTVSRVLREIIDPNEASLRQTPRNDHDLIISASNSWVLCLDNLSHIPIRLSDSLCRLSTGGGFATRELYTNTEEQLFHVQRPVIVNGIEELAVRGDLIDRTIVVNLPQITEEQRWPEREFWIEFGRLKSGIFGALLDAVSQALRQLPHVELERLPRLADFALWAVAGEEALGLPEGAFMEIYTRNRQSSNDLVLEASRVAEGILSLMSERTEWDGTASELLKDLELHVDEKVQNQKSWPKSPRGLSDQLKRLAPNLRATGVEVEFTREPSRRRRRLIHFRLCPHSCVHIVHSSEETHFSRGKADSSVDAGVDAERDRLNAGEAAVDGVDEVDAGKHAKSNGAASRQRWGF